jgi:hypothetical protein
MVKSIKYIVIFSNKNSNLKSPFQNSVSFFLKRYETGAYFELKVALKKCTIINVTPNEPGNNDP